MHEVFKWRVYCNTETTWTYGYLDEDQTPTSCFNDNSHIINTNSMSIVEVISDQIITVKEEVTPTGGHFKIHKYKIVCPPGASEHDYSYPYPISALNVTLNTTDSHTDDELEVIVSPDTIVGVSTSDTNVSDNVINVSQTVVDNVKIGYYLSLFDGVNSENLGRVVNVNKNNLQVSVETPCTQIFTSGSFIRFSIKVIDYFTIGFPANSILGTGKIGGSYIPTNTIVRIKYTNNGETTKNIYPILEYLY